MFIVVGGGFLVILGLIVMFFPPNFDDWDECKLYLLSANPIKQALGFVFCTLYAFEFIIWYLVFCQLLRLFVWFGPFFFLYLLIKLFLS